MTDLATRTPARVPEYPHVVQINTLDIDEARALLNQFYYPIAVGAPDGAERFSLDFDVIRMGPLTVGQLRFCGVATTSWPACRVIVRPAVGRVTW